MKYNNSRLQIYLPLILAFVFVCGMLLGNRFNNTDDTAVSGNYSQLDAILSYIKDSYVDTVNTEKLRETSIQLMLEQLDPHSAYIPASDFSNANDPLIGNFQGIGIEFRVLKDTVIVMNVIPGGPSAKTGLRAGDKILKVNNKSIAGIKINSDNVVKLLKGPKGTKVTVHIKRSHITKLLPFTITRDIIPLYSVDTYYMLDASTGYVKVSRFAETTADEFHNALVMLNKNKMNHLIIDLRGNSGGVLSAAIEMVDELLDKGKLIVYTKGRKRPAQKAYASNDGLFEKGKVTVLIDEFSASASEIMAGAIQDNDRGVIVGRRTFGKGLVQEQIQLDDGAAVRLTVARYYTPSGRCIQRPYDHGAEDYYTDFYKRIGDNSDSANAPKDTTVYKTLKGRKVYGGGGITPDIIIPLKSDKRYHLYNQLFDKGVLYQFIFDYIEKNKTALAAYKNNDDFIKQFQLTPAVYNEMIAYGKKNGITTTTQDATANQKDLIQQMKALIGRQLFNEDTYYKILNQQDEFIEKARTAKAL